MSQGRISGDGQFILINKNALEGIDIPFEEVPETEQKPVEPVFPSIPQQINNALGAIGRATLSFISPSNTFVSEEEQDKRKDICGKCEFLVNNRCSKCGCYYSLKIKLATEKCPIELW